MRDGRGQGGINLDLVPANEPPGADEDEQGEEQLTPAQPHRQTCTSASLNAKGKVSLNILLG